MPLEWGIIGFFRSDGGRHAASGGDSSGGESECRSRVGSAPFSASPPFALVFSAILGYYYVQFSRIIEARLHGERDRVIPRVFARPLTLRPGQGLTESELVARLNDVGYTEKSRVERAG